MTLTRADHSHLNRALKIAGLSTERQRHGSVISSGRRVLAVGVNTFRSNPAALTDPKSHASFHAEVAAIRSLRSVPSGATLYVARIFRSGEPALSKPCPACSAAITTAGIRRIVYSTDGGGYGLLTA